MLSSGNGESESVMHENLLITPGMFLKVMVEKKTEAGSLIQRGALV